MNRLRFPLRALQPFSRRGAALCLLLAPAVAGAGDWPTFRHDAARSGATEDALPDRLALRWEVQSAHPHTPAWPVPAEELPRVHADNAPHAVIAGGRVFFGSPADNSVRALDAESGRLLWRFTTQGPVRFAPCFHGGRIYFGSDDGQVYCLAADSGRLCWRHRAGPSGEKILGNGRMISLWPVRTSVLVDGGQVLFGAGVFPNDGIIIGALDPETGAVLWQNDRIGDLPFELSYGGISPFGYLAASPDLLFVPSGRAMPAVFARRDGAFQYYAAPGGKSGGAWAMLDGSNLIAGVDASGVPMKMLYDAASGARRGQAMPWNPPLDLVAGSGGYFAVGPKGLSAMTPEAWALALAQPAARQPPTNGLAWQRPTNGVCALIAAGNMVIAGGEGFVAGLDAASGVESWRAPVNGRAYGLAAAGGRLVVSTDQGALYGFGAPADAPATVHAPPRANRPDPDDALAARYAAAAEAIVKTAGVTRGYALVRDAGEGRLACELARRTDLQIVALEADTNKVALARARIEEAGLDAGRVTIAPWDPADLPAYFANLIVADAAVTSGAPDLLPEAYQRLLRPDGGVALARRPGAGDTGWEKTVRGKLEGAGDWTSLYANPANTACSEDQLVKSPLGTLWFGDPGPLGMVDRHSRPVSPLCLRGRLFVQGENFIAAYDAYNGAFLWRRDIPGAIRVRADVDGSNLALTEDGLYVAAGDRCHRLDPATGATLNTYTTPPAPDGAPRRWGWLAASSGTVFGIAARPLSNDYAAVWTALADTNTQTWRAESEWPAGWSTNERKNCQALVKKYPRPNDDARMDMQRSGLLWHSIAPFPHWYSQPSPLDSLTPAMMAGDTLFALAVETGDRLWEHRGERLANIAVAIDRGVIYCADTTTAPAGITNELARLAADGIYEPDPVSAEVVSAAPDVRTLLALDAATGRVLWRQTLDLTGCGGDRMGLASKDGILLCFGHFSNHDTPLFISGRLTWRRVTALDARTGTMLWSRPLNYLRRPLIVGDRLIVEPRAVELRTGRTVTREHPVTGQPSPWEFLRPGHCCSIASASAHTLFYRSSWTAIYDLSGDKGVRLFGGIRPGCWLNMISAGGIMVMPDSSSGCTCSYPLRCSLALIHKPGRRAQDWTVFVTHGALTPVRRLGLNFGAPADWRDDNGKLWLGYPRPKAVSDIGYGRYGIPLDLRADLAPGLGCATRPAAALVNSDARQEALFRDDCRGLRSCELPLIDDLAGQAPGRYTVRLGFCAPAGDTPGSRRFDVWLQDQLVATQLDVTAAAGGPDRPLFKEVKGVPVRSRLRLRLATRDPADMEKPDRCPLISCLEVEREDSPPAASADKTTPGDALLAAAQAALAEGRTQEVMARCHDILDTSTDDPDRLAALTVLASLGRPESLRCVLDEWNRGAYPILDEYRERDPAVLKAATLLFLAIAANPATAKEGLLDPINERVEEFLVQLPTSRFRARLVELCGPDRRAIPFLRLLARAAAEKKEALATRRAQLELCLRFDPALGLETVAAMLEQEENPAAVRQLEATRLALLGRLEQREELAKQRGRLRTADPAAWRATALAAIDLLADSDEYPAALEAIDSLLAEGDHDPFGEAFLLGRRAACLRAMGRAVEAEPLEARLASVPAAAWIRFVAKREWTNQPCPPNVPRPGEAIAAAAAPRIDGRLDDACWQSGPLCSGFIGNDNPAPADPQTLFALRYDREHLYAAVLAVETDPGAVRVNHDAIWEGDSIEVFAWDEAGTNEYGQLLISAAGDLSQARTWQGPVTAAASSNQLGWIIELRIPAASLGLKEFAPGARLRLNLCRNKTLPAYLNHTWSDVGNSFHNKTRFGAWTFR